MKINNPDLRIINIYINSNEAEKSLRETLMDELMKLIQEAKRNNFRLIVMGDMNADIEKYDKNHTIKNKVKQHQFKLFV